MNDIELTIGSDPEFFVYDKQDERFVSAHNLLPGTKEEPYPVRKGSAVQVDGIAAELNTRPHSDTRSFASELNLVKDIVEREFLGDRYKLVSTPVVRLDKDIWDSLPDEVKELGCDPDYDAYTGQVNPVPDAKVDFRTGAGHVHIGWTEDEDPENAEHFEACQMLARSLDFFLGFPLSKIEPYNKRTELYGKAGAFRPKTYGMEYRTPSNFWTTDPRLMRFVASTVKNVFHNMMALGGEYYDQYYHGPQIPAIKAFVNGERNKGVKHYTDRIHPIIQSRNTVEDHGLLVKLLQNENVNLEQELKNYVNV